MTFPSCFLVSVPPCFLLNFSPFNLSLIISSFFSLSSLDKMKRLSLLIPLFLIFYLSFFPSLHVLSLLSIYLSTSPLPPLSPSLLSPVLSLSLIFYSTLYTFSFTLSSFPSSLFYLPPLSLSTSQISLDFPWFPLLSYKFLIPEETLTT